MAFTSGDAPEEKPLTELFGSDGQTVAPADAKSNLLDRLFQPKDAPRLQPDAALSRDALRNRHKLKDWRFKCPQGHIVDGNPGSQFVLAVVGPSGSSKSHVLPGLLWETDALERLHSLGVSLRKAQYSDIELEAGQRDIYQLNQVMPATLPTDVLGPYTYKVSFKQGADAANISLLLFDVGGEAVASATNIGEVAKFVLLARAIVYLIDPDGLFPTSFDPEGMAPAGNKRIAAVRQRVEAIRQTADALSSVWGPSMNETAFVFAVAKSDSVEWAFDWASETTRVIAEAKDATLSEALRASSARVRQAIIDVGGERICNEISARIPDHLTRFVSLAATSQMPMIPEETAMHSSRPEDARWDEPEPNGIALALLQAMDASGHNGSEPSS